MATTTTGEPDENLAEVLTALSGFAALATLAFNSTDRSQLENCLEQIQAAANRATLLYRQFHILRLHGGIEPEVIGPFATEDERDDRAIELRKENDEDVILALDGPGSSIEINAYSTGFFIDEANDKS